jgi:hypothetical protein
MGVQRSCGSLTQHQTPVNSFNDQEWYSVVLGLHTEVRAMKTERKSVRRKALPAGFQRQRPTEEEIRARAYQIYLERGDAPGSDVEDWLQAEAELQPVLAKAQVA